MRPRNVTAPISMGVVICVLMIGLLAAPASAERRAPALDAPSTRSATVVFTGRVGPSAKVTLQVRRAQRWKAVGRDRASARGRFRIELAASAAPRRFRVVSNGRASAARKVKPSPTPAPAPSDACGVQPARPGGGLYNCSFVDEFNGTSLDRSVWFVMNNGQGADGACAVDSPRTVAVKDGSLRLTVMPTDASLVCPPGSRTTSYATGSVNTYGRWSQQYGRFEARMKSQVVNGAGPQEAFWLWPDARDGSTQLWPAAGEIDIVETYAAYPNLAIPYLHYGTTDNGGPIPGLNTAWNCASSRGEWHTYALDWTADRLTISVDGRTCLTNTAGASSFRKRFIMAFTQLLSSTGVNAYVGAPVLPATLEVDYVKVWQ